jgi:hypothetical protein
MYTSSAFSVANPFFMYVQALCLQDYEKACGAFLEGVKLEPWNAEIEEGLRYPTCPFWLDSSLSSSDNCLTKNSKKKKSTA